MKISRALITAGGTSQRRLPLQSLVDRDGVTRTALAILIDEVVKAGIDSIGVVINADDASVYRAAAGEHSDRLTFIPQTEPLGYAHAIHTGAAFTGDEPFLLLVGDHLYLSHFDRSCAQQLIEVAKAEKCSVSAVQATHESQLPYYGAVGGKIVNAAQHLYQIDTVLEKPTPTEAEQKIIVAGLRAGYYLCFFGMHVLTPLAQQLLAQFLKESPGNESSVNFRRILDTLASSERYLACELHGRRYDIDAKYGLLNAQLALSLAGVDRDEVLKNMVDLLASTLRSS